MTDMTYEESAQLINDPQFRGRVKVAVLSFAGRIMLQGPGSGLGANGVFRWAQNALQNPDAVAQQVVPTTVMEPGVQSQGPNIDDGGLQFSVENAVAKIL